MRGWHRDPFGRFDERYFIDGEPTHLVRSKGVEQQDQQPLSSRTPPVALVDRPEGQSAARKTQQGRTLSTPTVAILVCGLVAVAAISAGAVVVATRSRGRARSASAPVVAPSSTRPASTPPISTAPTSPTTPTTHDITAFTTAAHVFATDLKTISTDAASHDDVSLVAACKSAQPDLTAFESSQVGLSILSTPFEKDLLAKLNVSFRQGLTACVDGDLPTAAADLQAGNLYTTEVQRDLSGGADVQASLTLIQKWATALATGDWSTARQLDPALARTSDQGLIGGYAGLKKATIAFVSGNGQNLDVASVAYEDVGSGRRTNVYCYQVAVDATTTTLTIVSDRQATRPPIPGWVDPASLSSTIATC